LSDGNKALGVEPVEILWKSAVTSQWYAMPVDLCTETIVLDEVAMANAPFQDSSTQVPKQ